MPLQFEPDCRRDRACLHRQLTAADLSGFARPRAIHRHQRELLRGHPEYQWIPNFVVREYSMVVRRGLQLLTLNQLLAVRLRDAPRVP